MVIELTPETFFDTVRIEGPMHVVMHYGATCGPCKSTMPHYEVVAQHFIDYGRGERVKFYKFHQWQPEYKEFITEHNLGTNGVPTFRFYYFGEEIEKVTSSYADPNVLKRQILDVSVAINSTMGGFDLDKN
jgi:thiol-disulfide isomerase/thioredoxin